MEVPLRCRPTCHKFPACKILLIPPSPSSILLRSKSSYPHCEQTGIFCAEPCLPLTWSSRKRKYTFSLPCFPGGFSLAHEVILAECRMMPESASKTTVGISMLTRTLLNFLIPETCGVGPLCSVRINCSQWHLHAFPVCPFWQAWEWKRCQRLAHRTCPKQLFTQFEFILVNWINNSPLQKIYKFINMPSYIPNRKK